jgi:hypothetical protein
MTVFSELSLKQAIFNQTPQVGAKILTFDAGTSNARSAYRNGAGSLTAYTQPFFTDVNGQIPPFWISGSNAYRVRVVTPNDVQIFDVDNIPGELVIPTAPTVSQGLVTGDILYRFDTAERAGFVRLNGKTVGSSASGADYADDNNQALYVLLYNGISTLTVAGGRGANALADFGAAKPLSLPDMRGRAPFGLDTMGNSLANRLSGVTFATGSSSALGSTGGEALHVLTIAELASHNHTGTTDAAGGHTPAGTLDTQGAHTHTGTSDAGTAHHHAYTVPQPALLNIGSTPATVNVGATTTNTGDESAHTHTFTTASNGAHTHTFTGTAVAAHTHTYTGNSTGSGTAHNTMPPFILGTWYCKI